MDVFQVVIPKEELSVIEFRQKEIPGVAQVNVALREFSPRIVFAWHLSLMIQLEDVLESGLPTAQENSVLDGFEKQLDLMVQGEDSDKPNALFLAGVNWNGTRELIWRVFEPQKVHQSLQTIVNAEPPVRPRPFDYRIDHDPEWELATWHLTDHPSSSKN